jgi:hypothetical protein
MPLEEEICVTGILVIFFQLTVSFTSQSCLIKFFVVHLWPVLVFCCLFPSFHIFHLSISYILTSWNIDFGNKRCQRSCLNILSNPLANLALLLLPFFYSYSSRPVLVIVGLNLGATNDNPMSLNSIAALSLTIPSHWSSEIDSKTRVLGLRVEVVVGSDFYIVLSLDFKSVFLLAIYSNSHCFITALCIYLFSLDSYKPWGCFSNIYPYSFTSGTIRPLGKDPMSLTFFRTFVHSFQ